MMEVELLAQNTNESIAIWRVGPIVYKLLRPLEHFRRAPWFQTPQQRREQFRRQEQFANFFAGRFPHVVNPRLYFEEASAIVSPFVRRVRRATRADVKTVRQKLPPVVWDLSTFNIVVTSAGPVLIDFEVNSTEFDKFFADVARVEPA